MIICHTTLKCTIYRSKCDGFNDLKNILIDVFTSSRISVDLDLTNFFKEAQKSSITFRSGELGGIVS